MGCPVDCTPQECAVDFGSLEIVPGSVAAGQREDVDGHGGPCTVSQDSADRVTRGDDDTARPYAVAVVALVPFVPFADTPVVLDKAPETVDVTVLALTMADRLQLPLAFAMQCPELCVASLALEQTQRISMSSVLF